jgi:subtilisin family serine protease
MPTRRSRPALAALAAVCLLALGGAAGAVDGTPVGAAGWQGLLGSRPTPQLGGRWIVVFRAPSLADRVRRAGGAATEQQMRSWTATAQATQRRAIAGLWARGAPVTPEQSYVRVLNGFAASIDATFIPAIERDPSVAGVYPVRAAYPAAAPRIDLDTEAFGPTSGRRVGIEIPGFDGAGVTVALLDTGVDLRHPYLQGRLLHGIDVLDADGDPAAEPNPTEPGRPERHGTGLAGLVAGVRGPAGLHGVAPGASILPIRVAGWQPDADGGVSVYGRTDQVLAGLEAAVDPNGDGDAHDAARVALLGVVEPFASFPDSPLARAGRGALALDTLVVVPGGNDGPAGPGYGSIAGPAGTSGVLSVAASDSRGESPTVHVLLRAGLRVLASGETALGGAAVPSDVVSAPVVALPRRQAVAVTKGSALDRLFDTAGYSRVAGHAVLLPSGPTTPEAVGELASAGARAVLVDGPIPAGSLGVDEPVQVPVVGVPTATAAEVRRTLAAGVPVELGVGAAAFGRNPDLGAQAPFSSTGLAFDGSAGTVIAAPGVGLVSSVPGHNEGGTARYGTVSGSSAAAAVVAGSAALLAQARPVGPPGRGRRRAGARQPVGGIGRRARRRPAGARARPADRKATSHHGARRPAERLAACARRPPAREHGSRGRRRADEPRPRRPAARRLEANRPRGRPEGAPGRTGGARGRDPGGRGARVAPADRLDGRGSGVAAHDHARVALEGHVHGERPQADSAHVRRGAGRRVGRAAPAPAALPARGPALPGEAPRGHAGPSPRRAARAVRDRGHGARAPGRAAAAGRVRAPHRGRADRRRGDHRDAPLPIAVADR